LGRAGEKAQEIAKKNVEEERRGEGLFSSGINKTLKWLQKRRKRRCIGKEREKLSPKKGRKNVDT